MEHLGVLKNLFLGRRLENRSTRSWRKTSRSKGENQQQTQPTYGINICRYSKSALTAKPPFLQINDDSVCSHGV